MIRKGIQKYFKSENLITCGKSELNLEDYNKIKYKIKNKKPDIFINPTACTNVNLDEKENIKAKKINVFFIHSSSEYVYDGNKNM